eukprot:GHVU01069548.1.p1 GENE.GHVU01069548.1~~GHVU01069548.1.p1  ORF type:complete len:562 (+),score=68.76 GHVU01069548.1:156-1841(+)
MAVEIREVAADVSWHSLSNRCSHKIFKKVNDGFEIVGVEAGAPTIDNCFKEDDWPEEDSKRDVFWKLHRYQGCDELAHSLVDMCIKLDARGVKLQHEGVNVQNFFLLNGPIDTSDLAVDSKSGKPWYLSVRDPKSGKSYKISPYTTESSLTKLDKFPNSIRLLLGMKLPDREYRLGHKESWKPLADYLKVSSEFLTPHWWCGFVLESGRMIHVDLCGPAYNLYFYQGVEILDDNNKLPTRSSSSLEAPVYITVTPQLSIMKFPLELADKFPHKLMMCRSSVDPDGSARIQSLPDEFRPFKHADKLNLEVTPVSDEARSGKRLAYSDEVAQSIVDKLVFRAIQRREDNVGATACINGIVSRKELNDREFPLIGVNDKGRVIIEIDEGKEKITVATKTVTLRQLGGRQFLTLAEMRKELGAELKKLQTDIHIPKGDRGKKDMRECGRILQETKAGKELYQRVFVTGNAGITTMTDPELLPVVKQLTKLKFKELFFNDKSGQRQWEVVVELSEHPKFDGFRRLLMKLRTGISPAEMVKEFEEEPSYVVMYDKLVKEGLLRPRPA